MSSIANVKEKTCHDPGACAPRRYQGSDAVLLTLALLVLVSWVAILSLDVSLWLVAPAVSLISLFSVRFLALMHECGHRSLFRNQRLNRVFGFLLGVASGMPQYV